MTIFTSPARHLPAVRIEVRIRSPATDGTGTTDRMEPTKIKNMRETAINGG